MAELHEVHIAVENRPVAHILRDVARVADFCFRIERLTGGIADLVVKVDASGREAMVAALLKIVTETRDIGFYDQAPYHPKIGCVCGSCLALRALARCEGGGRCILCGCTDAAACPDGCSWVDRQHFLCSAHPEEIQKAALRFIEKWNEECTQTKEASHGKSEAAASNQGHRAKRDQGSQYGRRSLYRGPRRTDEAHKK